MSEFIERFLKLIVDTLDNNYFDNFNFNKLDMPERMFFTA